MNGRARNRWRTHSLLIIGALAISLLLVGVPAGSSPVRAQGGHDSPPISAFALPPSIFPAGSVVRGGRATATTLELASGLHTVPLADFNHLSGYLQTAWWWPVSQADGRRSLTSIQYTASIFGSTDKANRAYADARASLWELGYPLPGRVANSPTFGINERSGDGGAYLLLHGGPFELELRLRYRLTGDRRSLDAGLWALRHAALAAWSRLVLLTQNLPVPAPPSANSYAGLQPAPPGTGPVVKNASLMVPGSAQVGTNTRLDPGSFRTSEPPLAVRAIKHPRLTPPPGRQHYVRTATVDGATGWYDTATLYGSPQLADAALLAIGHANRFHTWLQPYPLNPRVWHDGRLAAIDNARVWRMNGETIFVLRLQNILMVLAEMGQVPDDLAPLIAQLATTVPTWLHAQGTSIVTATGDPIRLASVNWYGAEESDFVVGGLDYQPYQAILQRIKSLGFNSIRLPFSNELVEKNPVVTDHLAANPDLLGLHALDIIDRIVNYAGALGLSIILDDHRSEAGWSTQPDGLWYTAGYPESAFNRDWVTLAQRFAQTNVVIGADLRNEPHANVSWGDGNVLNDWHAAAERAGNAVLTSNPHVLIMVEGIQFYRKAPGYWWGGSLMGVADDPVVLHFADGSPAGSQLVYSVHDYGPDLCGQGCPWLNQTTSYASLAAVWDQYWGFVAADPAQPYAAPIWVGEFGTCDYQQSCVVDATPGSQGQWFSSLVKYISDKRLGWSYWAINGTQSTAGPRIYGAFDWYGLFDHTWTAPHDWLAQGLRAILGDGSGANPPL